MFQSFRVAVTAIASFVLLAAGEAPVQNAKETSSQTPAVTANVQSSDLANDLAGVQFASLTPATEVAPRLGESFDFDDERLAASDTADSASVSSLRELVQSITDLPTIELSEDMRCLATAVYFESKGEPLEGQLAVAQVILNRVADARWQDSVCGVVYQRGQFSFTWDRHSDNPANTAVWRTAQAIAVIAATRNWNDVAEGATHFHATRVSPGWRGLTRIATLGNHVFYR